jgi:predicted Rdx family selenoprotein
MLKAVTLKEIERIFAVIDPMGISREAVEIPLRTEHPGRISILKNGKLEIVVERDGDFEDWISRLEAQIRDLMKPEAD